MGVYNISKKFKNKARENLAKNILSMRYERDLSQEQLAELSHSSRKYISDVELGKRKASIDFMYNIAKAFGVPCYTLLMDNPNFIPKPRVDSKK